MGPEVIQMFDNMKQLAESPAPLADRLTARIQQRLGELALTPITAATRAGLPRDTIRNIFRQGSLPRVDTLAEIARALDTSVAWLVGEPDTPAEDRMRAIIREELSAFMRDFARKLGGS